MLSVLSPLNLAVVQFPTAVDLPAAREPNRNNLSGRFPRRGFGVRRSPAASTTVLIPKVLFFSNTM